MKEYLQSLVLGEPAKPEAVTAMMTQLMAGNLDPAIAGAFLTLQMRNGIDGRQLKAALEVMLSHARQIAIRDTSAIDNCGTGGDGGGGFNVSTTAAFVIAGAGHTVAKHGNRAVSSSCGSADLLEALGVDLALTPEKVGDCIDQVGIGFMFAPVFHPAVRHAVPIRKALQLRTIFNMLGPLANPAHVRHQLIGVFHPDLTEIFADTLVALGKTAFVVHGGDGSDEISLTHPTKVTHVKAGQHQTTMFNPKDHGFHYDSKLKLPGGSPEENLTVFQEILETKSSGPASDLVILNAGFAMMTTGEYQTLEDAFSAARNAISTGAAWDKVKALIQWTQQAQ